jgi:hypothetical protein
VDSSVDVSTQKFSSKAPSHQDEEWVTILLRSPWKELSNKLRHISDEEFELRSAVSYRWYVAVIEDIRRRIEIALELD